jgi:hypothetical protein
MKNNYRIKTIAGILTCLWISAFSLSAQTVIRTTIDSTHILIGQQTKIHLEIATDRNQPLQIPWITDTLTKGVEVIGISRVDTTDIGNNRMQLKSDYVITSFDADLYLLPPFRVVSGTDTVFSTELALKVSTFEVDTESGMFFDIKDVRKPPFYLLDFLPDILLALTAVLLIALIGFVIYRTVKKKPIMPFSKAVPYVPPHIRAIEQLDEIKSHRLWQSGREKEYHSDITDTLRKYIEERFDVGAMEMTSGEILTDIRRFSDVDMAYDNLKQILLLADFVKFAKYKPLPDENELSMMNAYLFVNNTKKDELTEEAGEAEEMGNFES